MVKKAITRDNCYYKLDLIHSISVGIQGVKKLRTPLFPLVKLKVLVESTSITTEIR